MAWADSLLLLLVKRLFVNLDSFFLGVFLQAMFLTSMVSATARTFFGISKTGSESVAEGTASKPMRRMNERPKETQKVQKGMDADSKEVSYTCQKPPDSDIFFLPVDRQKLSDSGGSLTLSFNRESCPYFDTVRHWSDTPRF
ncbi:hypothetical protein BD560DRAFT_429345 [Blakeslea trispora]|nr:hypothetical protein BD560DRAFT_429345 [Blakeslea trispora]